LISLLFSGYSQIAATPNLVDVAALPLQVPLVSNGLVFTVITPFSSYVTECTKVVAFVVSAVAELTAVYVTL